MCLWAETAGRQGICAVDSPCGEPQEIALRGEVVMGLTTTGIFIIGVLCGMALALVAPFIWRRVAPQNARRHLTGVAASAVFAIVTAVTFFTVGLRHSAPQTQGPVSAARPAAAPAAARSMDAEVASLETRLAREGGSEADWSLLERAYEMLGRPQDAQRAHAHIANPAAAPAPPMSAATLASVAASLGAGANSDTPAATTVPTTPAAPSSSTDLERAVQANPRDTASWLALAEARRSVHDYQGARDALDRVIGLRGMSAQAWADYADVSASLAGGSLAGPAGTAIDNALALDPANAKALWLKASQAHEQRRYGEALSWWQKLRAVLPPDSADLRIIDSNIAEDKALAAGAPAVAAVPASGNAAEVSGEVTLDQRFAGRVASGTTMFIYAKAADSPGPPLAVMRTVAGSWPVRFRLDDSMAMLPSRRISQFNNVVVEARISRTGQATPSTGDLYATSSVLHPGTKKLVLVIDHEIS